MFAPDLRACDPIDMTTPLKDFISFNYGDGMWTDMANDM